MVGRFLVTVSLTASFLPACGGGGSSAPVKVAQSSQARDTNPSVPPADATQLATDNRAFALSLYQTLRASAGSDDNLVFSPTSISIALAMLYNGAGSDTATAIATALDFTLPVDRLNAAFDALDLALTTPPAGADAGTFTLSLADSLWAQQDFPFLPAYLDTLAVDYGAGINLVDFEQAPESARAAINGWVSDQTEGLIPMLLPTGSIDATTRLVLANAVYFHGDWVTPFKSGSPNGTFHAAAGDVSVPMMSGAGNGMVWSGNGLERGVSPLWRQHDVDGPRRSRRRDLRQLRGGALRRQPGDHPVSDAADVRRDQHAALQVFARHLAGRRALVAGDGGRLQRRPPTSPASTGRRISRSPT